MQQKCPAKAASAPAPEHEDRRPQPGWPDPFPSPDTGPRPPSGPRLQPERAPDTHVRPETAEEYRSFRRVSGSTVPVHAEETPPALRAPSAVSEPETVHGP